MFSDDLDSCNKMWLFHVGFIVDDFLQHAARGKRKEKEISRHIHIRRGLVYQRYLYRGF